MLRHDDQFDGNMPHAPTCKAPRSDDKLYEYAGANNREHADAETGDTRLRSFGE